MAEHKLLKYVQILQGRVRASIALSAQYRWDFITDGLLSVFWNLIGLIPLLVAFGERPTVAGWTYPQVLLVVGWFITLKGFFSAMFFPSLLELATKIRDGSLDFLLTKPADALFLLSTSRFEFWRLIDALVGSFFMGWALWMMGGLPSIGWVALGCLLFFASFIALYSITVLVGSLAFFAVRLEGLPHVFNSVLDFARWPVTIFQGAVRVFFTWVLPLAVLTTYPAMALSGRLELLTALEAILFSMVLFFFARFAFSQAVGRYTSASS
jgi:ABC-2 type transport system permease protein